MRIFGEITKLEPQDDGTLKVLGIASSGAVDAADERVSPAAMKAALPDYMRFGALREMHGMTAAGATLGADVDDHGVTRIEAHVVDPLAVKKVKLGVYKGFSIGGRVTARDPSDPKTITALKLDEISLVDRPCNPEAVISMWKADLHPGARTPTNAEVIAKAKELAAAAGKRGRHTEFVVKAREALSEVSNLAPLQAASKEPDPLIDVLEKLGARNSAQDLARIQAAHDQLVALGAQCGSCDGDEGGACGESPDHDPVFEGGPDPDLDSDDDGADKALSSQPLTAAEDTADDQIDALRRALAALQKRVDDVVSTPRAPKTIAGFSRAVTKAEDVSPNPNAINADDLRKYLESLPAEERGRLELRAALSRPIPLHN